MGRGRWRENKGSMRVTCDGEKVRREGVRVTREMKTNLVSLGPAPGDGEDGGDASVRGGSEVLGELEHPVACALKGSGTVRETGMWVRSEPGSSRVAHGLQNSSAL
jgi:hypothetical protein